MPNTALIMTWGGLRGAISIALALGLTESMGRDLFLVVTYIIVIFSILVQGLTVEKLIAKLNLKKSKMFNYSKINCITKVIFGVGIMFSVFFGMAQEEKTFKIGMMVDSQTPETRALFEQLTSEVMAVVGEDATIIFPPELVLVNNFDVNRARENYNQLLASDADIILAIGSASNLIIQNKPSYPKPTILFGSINTDLTQLDLSKQTSEIDNFTYLMGVQSFKDDLKTFKELTDFSNVGIAIEKGIAESLPLDDTFSAILDELGASYRLIPFVTIEDIDSNLTDLDGLYLAGGFELSDAQVKILSEALIQKNIPSFTSTGARDVMQGIMATNNS